MVLRGETTAATHWRRRRPLGYGGDERYRSYDGEVRARPRLVAVAARRSAPRSRSAIGGWLVYDNVRDQIDANEPVTVDNYTGILEENAVNLIAATGSSPVRRLPNADVEPSYVFQQEPEPGTRAAEGQHRHRSSSRRASRRSRVPSLVGKSRDAAVAELTSADLEADRGRGQLRPPVGHRHRAGPAPGHRARRGLVGADQRLEGTEAGRRPERRRLELRRRGRPAAVGRVHGRARRRRERPPRRRGRRPEPARATRPRRGARP